MSSGFAPYVRYFMSQSGNFYNKISIFDCGHQPVGTENSAAFDCPLWYLSALEWKPKVVNIRLLVVVPGLVTEAPQ